MNRLIVEILGKDDNVTVENLHNIIKCSYPELNISNLRVYKGYK